MLDSLQTPCYIIEKAELEQNFREFQNALRQYWGKSILAYSVKTNPLPWLVAYAKKLGCYAEVVSDEEYELALTVGCSPQEIVFNGPVKGKASFFKALEAGGIVNLDSQYELDWLEEYDKKGRAATVGVRVNINLESSCPGESLTGQDGGRFG